MPNNENEKLNKESVDISKKDEIDDIMNGFYNLTSIYSEDKSERERAFREKEEKRRSREMEAIREDIERRYTLHYENAVSNAENKENTVPPAENENKAAENAEISRDEKKEKKNAEKVKKKAENQKKSKKQNRRESYVNENGNPVYLAIYNFGDVITKITALLFSTLFKIIVFPFKKLKQIFDSLTFNAKRDFNKRLVAIIVEIHYFKKEIKSAQRYLKICLKHPFSVPSVVAHYIKKAFARHKQLLKTAGNLILPVLSVIVMVTVFNHWKGVTFALEVIFNNEGIGYINDESVFIDARDMVLDRLYANGNQSEVNKTESAEFNAGYKLALVSLDELSDAETISDTMIEKSSEKFTNACGVYIDGKFICAIKNESDAKSVFFSILEPYDKAAEKGNYIVGFAENIDYVQGLYRDDAGIIWDASKLEQTLLGKEGATMTYTVADKDTISSIAYDFGTDENEIFSLNPGLSSGMLHTGTKIFVPSYTPLIRIKKTVTSSSIRSLDYATVKQKDASKYSGYRLVKQAGINGSERIITTKTYISGELYNTEYTFETLKEPVDEIIVVGSRTTYGGIYIGEASDKGFLWPAPHCRYISSPYGWRSIGWHNGVDLCTGNGTAYGSHVIAAKSGRVEAVQRSSSGYGNMVLINHGDGYKTRYAHMAAGSIKVHVGEYVEAGKAIGKVGSTGNSSGPHLHFEVIYNGETRDPRNYIS